MEESILDPLPRDGNQTFTRVIPDANAKEITFELPAGSGLFGSEPTLAVNRVIGIVPDVLAKNEITNWWWFNESLVAWHPIVWEIMMALCWVG